MRILDDTQDGKIHDLLNNMSELIKETSELFDWYTWELNNLAKLVNWYVDHSKIFIEFKDFFTENSTWLEYIKWQVSPVIRFKNVWWENAEMIKKFWIAYRIDMRSIYWVSQAKRDRIRTFEYFYKILSKEKDDKICDIRAKYWVFIPLKHFEKC